jgi:hypothetical protein
VVVANNRSNARHNKLNGTARCTEMVNDPITQSPDHSMPQSPDHSTAQFRRGITPTSARQRRASFEICVYANGYYGKSAAEPRKSKKKESKILQNEATKPNGINKSV